MYCVKDYIVYYVEGTTLKSYPDLNKPICEDYGNPIRNLMLVHHYVVVILDHYIQRW